MHIEKSDCSIPRSPYGPEKLKNEVHKYVYRVGEGFRLGLAAMVILAFSAPAAHAQVWVGSTGTVDPNSTGLVKYIDGKVGVTQRRLRLVLSPLSGITSCWYAIWHKILQSIEYRVFAARFLDDGAGHVFLALKQQNLSTGVITTLMTFDSNQSAAQHLLPVGKHAPKSAFQLYLGRFRRLQPRGQRLLC